MPQQNNHMTRPHTSAEKAPTNGCFIKRAVCQQILLHTQHYQSEKCWSHHPIEGHMLGLLWCHNEIMCDLQITIAELNITSGPLAVFCTNLAMANHFLSVWLSGPTQR